MTTKEKSLQQELAEAIESLMDGRRWTDVGETLEKLKATGLLDRDDFKAFSIAFAAKEMVRRIVRSRKDEEGLPLFPSITIRDMDSGKRNRVYMRERHMKPVHYQQVINYYEGYAMHGKLMANGFTERCNKRYETQLTIPFPELAATK